VTVTIVLLLALALALFISEAHLPSGVLGILGIAALVAAALLMRDEGYAIPIAAIVAGAILLGGLMFLVGRKVLSAQRDQPVRTGHEELAGAVAEARTPLAPAGQVFVQGAIWQARLEPETARVASGGRVRIDRVDGLTLVVRPENEAEGGTS
jgi:membrane-bound serine protease (ClpP class)